MAEYEEGDEKAPYSAAVSHGQAMNCDEEVLRIPQGTSLVEKLSDYHWGILFRVIRFVQVAERSVTRKL
uniref:Uncharacterized protein n=1 Tax=Tanacetum cinerariifolium TaxID=118510 RepID=A0A6L2LLY3_TANCI|nr:hypothetical protein [Tanacetum cinerariifolium]